LDESGEESSNVENFDTMNNRGSIVLASAAFTLSQGKVAPDDETKPERPLDIEPSGEK
jgi:hypothetical protein